MREVNELPLRWLYGNSGVDRWVGPRLCRLPTFTLRPNSRQTPGRPMGAGVRWHVDRARFRFVVVAGPQTWIQGVRCGVDFGPGEDERMRLGKCDWGSAFLSVIHASVAMSNVCLDVE
ncbi:unnamed protein product [Soboliphyme baturini]|uniref:Uncharacterized protein n=1 Tax=Soboliphyme baturini TaxID=241478 RepID=A0A183IA84_9BILA|nr:unnamed protein product [Soboliphyme baturini]